ncbi:B-cell receptor-associated protein 31-like [Artemia franciscana]|uniref:Endoplasmic reticulum transmembrane protein n=1 Tax=Artemia franciscana TaxID=6661 RepID=A0AA88IJC4_ARTSF|nr:hypothetical protein QYM36_002522 [Artemia franciscana]
MSFQWTVIAAFLYGEVVVVSLLLLPFISVQRWNKILKSRLLRSIGQQAHIYFFIIFGLLILCLLDSIRDVRRYTHESDEVVHAPVTFDNELKNHMKLFRAQRNFYITSFSVFLMFVIRRLTKLIMTMAATEATSEAAMRQARSATDAAEALLDRQRSEAEDVTQQQKQENLTNEAHATEVGDLKKQLENALKELNHSKKELEAMKSQSEAVNREYDRVSAECQRLQSQIDGSTDKKSE